MDKPKRHKWNVLLFCSECGVDAIGLQGWGPKAMECPYDKTQTATATHRTT